MLPTFFINQTLEKEALSLIEYDDTFKKISLFECIANELIEYYKIDNNGNAKALKTLLTHYANYFPKQLPFHIARLDTKDQIEYLLTYALREMKRLDHPSILQAIADHVLLASIYLERYQSPNHLPVKEYYLNANHSKALYLHYKDEIYLHKHIKNIGVN